MAPATPTLPHNETEAVRRAMSGLIAAAKPGSARIVRIEIPAPDVDPLAWLSAQSEKVRLYGNTREGDVAIAGIGQADVISSDDVSATFAAIRERVAGTANRARYFGGLRFGGDRAMDLAWRKFGACRFILPLFEFIRYRGRSILACNLPADERFAARARHAQEVLAAMQFPAEWRPSRLPFPEQRKDYPSKARWHKNVETVVDEIGQGAYAKLVLARRTCFEFGGELDPIALLSRIRDASKDCYHYCFNPGGAWTFIGASPERLYKRQGRLFYSEAVAGTRSRGDTDAADDDLGRELLGSAKDTAEHRLVVDSIRDAMAPLSDDVATKPMQLLKLAGVQHLYSYMEGALREGVTDADIITRIHPTPAVGGSPSAKALRELRRFEPFDRGWYASPIGWVSEEEAEFAVAIRCGLVGHSGLCLYSGAGIVAGSTPQDEWSEIESKIGNFMNVLIAP